MLTYIKYKWAENGFQKYFRNTSWLLIARMTSLILSLGVTIYIVRVLGPYNYGQLSYAISIIGLFAFISSLGIDGILYRELTARHEGRYMLLGTGFFLRLGAGILATCFAWLFATLFVDNAIERLLIYILGTTFIFIPFQVLMFEFQARVLAKYHATSVILVTIILSASKVAAIMLGFGVVALAFILLLEPMLYAIFYLFFYSYLLKESVRLWTFNNAVARQFIFYGILFMIINAASAVYGRIDQIFIYYMMDTQAVGLYDAAVRLAEVWNFVPGILLASLYPAVVNARKHSSLLYFKRNAKLGLLIFFLGISLAISTSIVSPYVIKILYGQSFIASIDVLQVYIWGTAGAFVGFFTTQYIFLEDMKKILLVSSILPMIINVMLNILLIPTYGIVGAAYATAVAYWFAPLSLFLFPVTRHWLINIVSVLYKKQS